MTNLAPRMNRLVAIVRHGYAPFGGRLDKTFILLGRVFAEYIPAGAKYSGRQDLTGVTAVFTIRADPIEPPPWAGNENVYIGLYNRGESTNKVRLFKIIKMDDHHYEYTILYCEELVPEQTIQI